VISVSGGGIPDPFAWWSLSDAYTRYAGLFDLVVFCSFFTALSYAALRRQFPGRPGKVLAVVLGLALGVALALAGERAGWSLRDAGPVAVGLLILVSGMMLYWALHAFHMPARIAVPVAILTVLLLYDAIIPAAMVNVRNRGPWTGLLAMLAALALIAQLALATFGGRSRMRRTLSGHGEPIRGAPPAALRKSPPKHCEATHAQPRTEEEKNQQVRPALWERLRRHFSRGENRELRALRSVRRETKHDIQGETKAVEHNLKALAKAADSDPPNWRAIEYASSHIAHRADAAADIVHRVRTLDRRLRTFDIRQFHELRQHYDELPEEQRTALRKQILVEREKIRRESEIDRLTGECEQRHAHLRHAMDEVGRAAAGAEKAQLLKHIALAQEIENQQRREIKLVLRAEKRLLALTKKKLREEQDAAD